MEESLALCVADHSRTHSLTAGQANLACLPQISRNSQNYFKFDTLKAHSVVTKLTRNKIRRPVCYRILKRKENVLQVNSVNLS